MFSATELLYFWILYYYTINSIKYVVFSVKNIQRPFEKRRLSGYLKQIQQVFIQQRLREFTTHTRLDYTTEYTIR